MPEVRAWRRRPCSPGSARRAALAPARQRRAVERKLMAEELLRSTGNLPLASALSAELEIDCRGLRRACFRDYAADSLACGDSPGSSPVLFRSRVFSDAVRPARERTDRDRPIAPRRHTGK